MSRVDKLLKRFISVPTNLKYSDIKTILLHFDFELIDTKGSHIKFKHHNLKSDIVIPVHNNECKNFYKKQILKILKENKFIK